MTYKPQDILRMVADLKHEIELNHEAYDQADLLDNEDMYVLSGDLVGRLSTYLQKLETVAAIAAMSGNKPK